MKPSARVVAVAAVALACLVFANGPVCGDTIYVAGSISRTIMEYDSNGNGSVFANASSGLFDPRPIAFDSNGNLFVADYSHSLIMKFDPSGHGSLFANSGHRRSQWTGL